MTDHSLRQSPLLLILILALSALAVVLALVCTTYTIGTTSDSVNYIMAARSLNAGEGYLACDGTPFVRFGPLYPTLLALPLRLGADALGGARVLNALTFGLIVFASALLFRAYLNKPIFIILALVTVTSSWALLFSAIHVLSEPLFTLFAILFVLHMHKALHKPSPGALLWMALWAALAALQRYFGATLIVVGVLALALLPAQRPVRKRLADAALFGIPACFLPALWLARNYLVSGMGAGNRGSAINGLSDFAAVLVQWFSPNRQFDSSAVATAAVLGLLLALLFTVRHARYAPPLLQGVSLNPMVFFTGAYLLIFVLVSQVMEVRIDNRMVAPVFPFLTCLCFTLAERTADWLNRRIRADAGTLLATAVVVLWLTQPLGKLWREVRLLPTGDFWTGFSTSELRDSPQVTWAKANPNAEPLYSEWQFPICLHANRYTHRLPNQNVDAATAMLLQAGAPEMYVVIFDAPDGRYGLDYDVRDLSPNFDIEPILDDGDEGIYRLARR